VAAGRRNSFNAVADRYDRARPRYPAELFDTVARKAGLDSSSRLLELGCGPGIATVPFAERGYEFVCIEPGEDLAQRTRAKVAAIDGARVRVETTTFEAWSDAQAMQPGELFDVVFAAQSFHWMDSATRFARCAAALREGGWLAVFGNAMQGGDEPVHEALRQIYARYEGVNTFPYLGLYAGKTSPFDQVVRSASEFRDVENPTWTWLKSYTATEYVEMVSTHSDHLMMEAERGEQLLREVGGAIDAAGGRIEVEYITGLYLAQRA
jgi:trans-aconitate methyltransferase